MFLMTVMDRTKVHGNSTCVEGINFINKNIKNKKISSC